MVSLAVQYLIDNHLFFTMPRTTLFSKPVTAVPFKEMIRSPGRISVSSALPPEIISPT